MVNGSCTNLLFSWRVPWVEGSKTQLGKGARSKRGLFGLRRASGLPTQSSSASNPSVPIRLCSPAPFLPALPEPGGESLPEKRNKMGCPLKRIMLENMFQVFLPTPPSHPLPPSNTIWNHEAGGRGEGREGVRVKAVCSNPEWCDRHGTANRQGPPTSLAALQR